MKQTMNFYCYNCNKLIEDDYTTINNELICKDCCENHYKKCSSCGQYNLTEESYKCEYSDKYYCEHCKFIIVCDCCEKQVHNDYITKVQEHYYCDECIEHECNTWFISGDPCDCDY